MVRSVLRSFCLVVFVTAIAAAQPLQLTPFHASGIYALGEPAGWTVTPAAGAAQPAGGYTYTIKENNFTLLKSGRIDPAAGTAKVEVTLHEPAMVMLQITPAGGGQPMLAGAAIAPTQLKPDTPRPADFEAFWRAKIKLLERVPANPVVTPGPSGRPGVEYATIRLNNFDGSHVYGQLAMPARPGKFPAMLIMQWAGGPYPLQRSWVTGPAAQGWLVLNVEPHDVPGNLPQAFYDALPHLIKNYTTIYNDDRNRNYFLRMYLGDYRAVDYLASRPEWNGKVLLATGASMGGQQSLAVTALNPKVTDMIVHVPAGADSNAALHGRQPAYPDWDSSNPKVMRTGLYFDTVNFAPMIHVPSLVSMGFIDQICPPACTWTAFNQIAGPKEAVPLVYAAHNNQSTPAQQMPFTKRQAAWLRALVLDQPPPIRKTEGGKEETWEGRK